MPIHFKINAVGDWEFRVDTQIVTGNITQLEGANAGTVLLPNDGNFTVKVAGLTPHVATGTQFGPNDPDDTFNKDDDDSDHHNQYMMDQALKG